MIVRHIVGCGRFAALAAVTFVKMPASAALPSAAPTSTIMPHRSLRFLLSACLATLSTFAAAQALQPVEESEAPTTLIPERDAGRRAPDGFSETRLPGGRVTEVEVRSGGSTYYVRPQSATGASQTGRTAQWNILNFDTARGAAPAAARDAAPAMPAPAEVPPPPALRSN